MVFTIERVVGDALKDRTIDYERDAIIKGGGHLYGSDVCQFGLTWKGHHIKFTAIYKKVTKDIENGTNDIFYEVNSCEYSEDLRHFKNQIRDLIKEGLEVHGNMYSASAGTAVHVTFYEKLKSLSPYYNWETSSFEDSPVATEVNLN